MVLAVPVNDDPPPDVRADIERRRAAIAAAKRRAVEAGHPEVADGHDTEHFLDESSPTGFRRVGDRPGTRREADPEEEERAEHEARVREQRERFARLATAARRPKSDPDLAPGVVRRSPTAPARKGADMPSLSELIRGDRQEREAKAAAPAPDGTAAPPACPECGGPMGNDGRRCYRCKPTRKPGGPAPGTPRPAAPKALPRPAPAPEPAMPAPRQGVGREVLDELAAMTHCAEVLLDLDGPAATRVARWITDRFGDGGPAR